MLGFERALVCENGHFLADELTRNPDLDAKFCKLCGAGTLKNCSCGAFIRGTYSTPYPGVSSWREIHRSESPPACCHDCGKPYPWTDANAAALRELIDETEGLTAEERERLTASIADIVAATPRSEVAVLRFKKAIAKVGSYGGKMLADLAVKVAAESVKGYFIGG